MLVCSCGEYNDIKNTTLVYLYMCACVRVWLLTERGRGRAVSLSLSVQVCVVSPCSRVLVNNSAIDWGKELITRAGAHVYMCTGS